MQNVIDKVLEWRKTFGLKTDGGGTEEEINLSNNLILEELNEFLIARINKDKLEVLDAIGDLFFVVVQRECMYKTPLFEDVYFVKGNISNSIEGYLCNHAEFSSTIFTLGFFCNLSFVNIEDLVEEIFKSNMSKLCKNKKTADKTIEKYKQEGIECYYKECPIDRTKYIVYRQSDNKVLKSVDFVSPNIEKFIK